MAIQIPTPEEEMRTINRFFADYKINATVSRDNAFIAGKSFVVFGVRLGAGARISKIESHLRELGEALGQLRQRPTPVRLRTQPLQLELPHPAAEPLHLPKGAIVPPHSMLLGQSFGFSGQPQQEIVNFQQAPHTLLAGTTGSGKSNLLSLMLWSLCANTPPEDLRLVLIDLKNEDMQPFVGLPHVAKTAMSLDKAASAVRWVLNELDQRISSGEKQTQRLVLVVDELAEMRRADGAVDMLASILGMGRSKLVNVVAATQKPTVDVIGSTNKSNYTLRLVGKVKSAKDGEVAAGTSGTGAEFLPGNGSFLYVDGMESRRFQAYFVPDIETMLEPLKAPKFEQVQWLIRENAR